MSADASGILTQELAGFVARTRFDDLPSEVVRETKRIILDVIGCALGSSRLEKGSISAEFARRSGGVPESTIFGFGDKVPAALAAFANAELIHATDHCPILPPAHISPFVTSPALALGESKGVSGKELIVAVALAHEVASRIGLSLDSMRVATGGIARSWGLSFDEFGAAAGAARILNLSESVTADALGLAGYFAPVPSHNKFLATPEGGGMAKYGPAGWTAQGGVTAAQLASMGYQGDRSVLDGDYGFSAMVGSQQFHPETITDSLGDRWNLLKVMYKRWPCAGNLQAPLGAFSKLIEDNHLSPRDIEAIEVRNEAFALQPRFQFGDLRHNVDTQTNLAYNISLAAHRIKISSAWQSSRYRDDPGVRELMRKVVIRDYGKAEEVRHRELVEEGREYIERRPCLVEIRAHGQKFIERAEYAYWLTSENDQYRASDDDLVEKFSANACESLSPAGIEAAVEKIMSLETLVCVSDLIDVLSERDT
ncbi:MmgE/PrpD family protein [Streptomyces sp. Mo3]|uniref:MmgE/PrpD family protein n=1 Tax=Streptomyces sp. Mo3 TaxID=3161190 RepID=UPI0039EE1C72|nr:MmgE/PrpD family protein [Streptomyces antimycoticus]